MNKGLELIEAHHLFGTRYDQIDVVVHPQSIVHSMVEWSDGATIAQLSNPDMRLPIGYALSYPDRLATPFGPLDWTSPTALTFEPPDRATFRCLDLAYAAARAGGLAPAWLSAANEIAVDAFLNRRIRWAEIAAVIEAVMASATWDPGASSVEAVIDADRAAREMARRVVENTTHG
jgi:1-deoxy-D-xylulose-5-phosphate reductoisomerase